MDIIIYMFAIYGVANLIGTALAVIWFWLMDKRGENEFH